MSPVRPSAAHPRAAPTRIGRRAPAATARANTAPSSATRRVPARSRARQHRRQPAISCGHAEPPVVRSSGLVPAPPALRAAPAQQSPDRRPIRASQPPVSASDSCHSAADSTPVLLPTSSLAQTTFVPSRKAESQLPLGGTSVLTHSFSTRRDVFFQRSPAACILLQDGIGFGGPFKRLRVGVTLHEPGLDGSLEFGKLLKTPRRICWRVISANSRSTRLIQDDDVGVKCSLKRGCLASQACTSLVL